MAEYSTKLFGNIAIDETNDYEFFHVNYKDNKISILLNECNIGNKIEACLEILDKYVEINQMAKRAIISNFPENEIIKNYFKIYMKIDIKNFSDLDIKMTLEKLEYPDLYFENNDGKIELSVKYKFSKKYPADVLAVKMDEQLNLLEFLNEYMF